MHNTAAALEIHGLPPHVASWSAARLDGLVPAVLERWRRSAATLPSRFVLVICPLVEVLARGGLPERVIELTDPRLRFQHFTGCHRPYVILIHAGADTGSWITAVQQQLAWSESYRAEFLDGALRLQFLNAVEELSTA